MVREPTVKAVGVKRSNRSEKAGQPQVASSAAPLPHLVLRDGWDLEAPKERKLEEWRRRVPGSLAGAEGCQPCGRTRTPGRPLWSFRRAQQICPSPRGAGRGEAAPEVTAGAWGLLVCRLRSCSCPSAAGPELGLGKGGRADVFPRRRPASRGGHLPFSEASLRTACCLNPPFWSALQPS